MSTVLFVAAVVGDQANGYRASFPDIAGCGAEGRDLSELIINARQALASRLDAFEGEGEAWPEPTPIERMHLEAGALSIPIDVTVDDPPIRVNISLGGRLVQRLDAAAQARGMTRSGFIAQSVRVTLGETRAGGDFDAVGRRLQDELNALAAGSMKALAQIHRLPAACESWMTWSTMGFERRQTPFPPQ